MALPLRPVDQQVIVITGAPSGYGGQERGTHEGHVRRRSLSVDATTHPALSTVAVLAVAGALLARRALPRSR